MKNAIKTKDAKKGGYLVGKPHSEGGIKGINVDTNEPIEVEGGEVVITKPAVESNQKYSFEGKQMTPKEILSKLNSDHGGVAFKEGGEIPKHKFGDGGKFLGGDEDLEVFRKYYVGRKFIRTTNDDFVSKLYTVKDIKLDNNNIFIVDEDYSEYRFASCLFIGSFIYIKPYYDKLKDIDLFGLQYYNDVIVKNGYNFYIPFQIKSFNITVGNRLIDDIVLGRIINGLYNQFELGIVYSSSDRIIPMPNPLVDLPADFTTSQEIIYPQNIPNVIEYADKIGQICLCFNQNDNLLRTYSVYELNYEISNDNISVRSLEEGEYLVRDKNEVLCVNDTVSIYFNNQDKFYEVLSYKKNDDTYYEYEANTSKTYSVTELSSNSILSDIKILGIKVKKETNAYYYQSIIFEFEGEIYANYRTDEDYGYDLKLESQITKGEPEYRFVNETISDLDKAIRKVRKKDTRDKVKYELLSKAAEAEISKYSILRGLVDKTNADKQVQIDRKLAELREAKDKYLLETDTGLELLNKLGNTFIQERLEEEKPDTSLMSINGVPTELTNKQWHKVRTDNFISWFGDWQMAYRTGNYGGVSKAINPRTKEPLVCYHGSRADFMAWRFNDFPAAYFADNRSYSQWFANLYGDGFMYQVFLDIKNPIDVMAFGIDAVPLRNIGDVLMNEYNIPREIALPNYDRYASAGIDQLNAFLDTPMQFWVYIRKFNTALLNYMREKTFYDGILMYEDNPQDIINGHKNVTGSYMVLRQEQIKWASAEHFNTQVENAGFAKGGILKEVNNKFNDDFFVL
jgi:hypothetical protein